MADLTDLKNPKIDTITITNKIKLVDFGTKRDEFYSTSDNNLSNLEKLGNFSYWIFRIYKVATISDADWTTLVTNLKALDNASLKDVEIDTVDNSGTIYKCFYNCKYDPFSEYPTKYIEIELSRYYSNENEV